MQRGGDELQLDGARGQQLGGRRAGDDDAVAPALEELAEGDGNAERRGAVVAKLRGHAVAAIATERGLDDTLLNGGEQIRFLKFHFALFLRACRLRSGDGRCGRRDRRRPGGGGDGRWIGQHAGVRETRVRHDQFGH